MPRSVAPIGGRAVRGGSIVMADHRFHVGQMVRMAHRYPDPAGSALSEVVRLMPAAPNGEFAYRVKAASGQERAASESQLSLAEERASERLAAASA